MSNTVFNIILVTLELLALLSILGNVILLFIAIFTIIKSNFNKKTKLGLIALSIFTLNIAAGIYFIKSDRSSLGSLILMNLLAMIVVSFLVMRIGAGLTVY